MMVYPYVNLNTDIAYWISADMFNNFIDQEDFIGNRAQVNVVDGYLESWFYENSDRIYFILPTITIVDGRTQFINGRHRLSVLLKTMVTLPVSFSESAQSYVHSYSLEQIDMSQKMELPNYCIYNELP
ncbi:hypothetical protein KCM76_25555 [Zooshikella marina]|uniref:hypothetical protein n=1 Tax=Zooshikella ganghwensis TaxID=202772 RepID=UPI001BAEFA6A|nr:hypothetical protein [Zooshikella ganghwensis]MBU2709383.1 hypothetical protein [Zooshikella ganghwensis]